MAEVRRFGLRRPAVLGLAAVMLLATIGFLVTTGSGRPLVRVSLSAGSAWLLTPDKGYITLVDGPSEQVISTALATSTGAGLSVSQDGASAFLADDGAGTVVRIDGATYRPSRAVQFAPSPAELTVLPAADSSFVVDARSRVASVVDPQTMRVLRTMSLSAQPAEQQMLATASGRLWTVDSKGAGLSWVDADGATGSVPAASSSLLIDVGRRVALVQTGQNDPTVSWISDQGEAESWACRLPSRSGDRIHVLGSTTADSAFAVVDEAGTLLIAGDDAARCGAVVQVANPGAVFGDLVQSAQYVFVPNRGTGEITVVDTDAAHVVATLKLTEPGNELELLNKDGVIFYNDLSSEKAGVLKLGPDGLWTAGRGLQKYNPATGEPEQAITEAADGQVPTNPQPEGTGPPTGSGETAAPIPSATNDDVAAAAASPAAESSPPLTPQGSATARSGQVLPKISRESATVVSRRTEPTVPTLPTGPTGRSGPVVAPTPRISDLTADSEPTAGSPVTVRASVTDPSGAWSWVVSRGVAELAHGSSEQAITFSVPTATAGQTITVTLKVGDSAEYSKDFAVRPPPMLETTTEIELGSTTTQTDQPVTIAASVNAADGISVPSGTVEMSFEATDGSSGSLGTAPLVGGRANFDARSFPSPAVVTFTASYGPDAATFATSSDTADLRVIPPPLTATTMTISSSASAVFSYPADPSCLAACFSMTATVTSAAGPVGAGQVNLVYPNLSGGMTKLSSDVDSDGRARFLDIGIDAAFGDTVVKLDYSGSPGFASSTGSKTVRVDPGPDPLTLRCEMAAPGQPRLVATLNGVQAGWAVWVSLRDQRPAPPIAMTDTPVSDNQLTAAGSFYQVTFTSGTANFTVGTLSVVDTRSDATWRQSIGKSFSVRVTNNVCEPTG